MGRTPKNPIVERCWVAGTNPFNLPQPPAWWLQEIHDYDSELVIFPTMLKVKGSTPLYRLARRRRLSRGCISLSNTINKHPDSVFMDEMGLIPVISFAHTGQTWASGTMLTWLKANDIWARGGAEKVIKALEESDVQAEADRKRKIRDDMDHRSRDAWRSYNARTGSRNKSARDGSRFAYGKKAAALMGRPIKRTAEPARAE
jgi:hypothetical protein